jgi:membrane protease subunit (stomatin/prohibitin family)
MSLLIKESHLKFDNGILISVAVVWEQFGEVRASYSDTKPTAGYYSIEDYHIPTMSLFQNVASGGRKLTDKEKKQYFPTHKIE